MADEPRLNSLSRFRKASSRLILETHSHCEVPAGCGGVVLRWRNPNVSQTLLFHLYTPGKVTLAVDGMPCQTARVDLAPGSHVLSLHVQNVDLAAGLIMLAALPHPRTVAYNEEKKAVRFRTEGDGSWRCSSQEPTSAAWMTTDFDDTEWTSLLEVSTPELAREDPRSYHCRRCAELGAACLALPESEAARQPVSWWQWLLGSGAVSSHVPQPGQVWIRKVFSVTTP